MTVAELIRRLQQYPPGFVVELHGDESVPHELTVAASEDLARSEGRYGIWSPDDCYPDTDGGRGWVPA